MRILGFEYGTDMVEDYVPLDLREVTLSLSPGELDALITFFERTKAELEAEGDDFGVGRFFRHFCRDEEILWTWPDVEIVKEGEEIQ